MFVDLASLKSFRRAAASLRLEENPAQGPGYSNQYCGYQ